MQVIRAWTWLPRLEHWLSPPKLAEEGVDRRARMLNFILLSTLLMWTVLGIAVRILHADHSQPLLMIGAIMAWEL
ncbi:MAG TPA: hypothetical protein VE136_10485, partial [Anaerolineales bacterium]|nr:hypothetical protein [Anaerolineales bacterium]